MPYPASLVSSSAEVFYLQYPKLSFCCYSERLMLRSRQCRDLYPEVAAARPLLHTAAVVHRGGSVTGAARGLRPVIHSAGGGHNFFLFPYVAAMAAVGLHPVVATGRGYPVVWPNGRALDSSAPAAKAAVGHNLQPDEEKKKKGKKFPETPLDIASGNKSIIVYLLSWIYVLVAFGIYVVIAYARDRYAAKEHIYYRLVQFLVIVLGILVIIALLKFTNFNFMDIFTSLLAFIPTGWGMILICQVLRPFLQSTILWELVVSVA
ncbi:hypothetical protein L484_004777 [Morus notabilis]|uniref:Uncharacterized protein n=1 Tax=Morus notabilis TaxID=981085 RepID=W9QI69_9ROSA|nr:hypothetical protein L484_004777 [Morus notabilis]